MLHAYLEHCIYALIIRQLSNFYKNIPPNKTSFYFSPEFSAAEAPQTVTSEADAAGGVAPPPLSRRFSANVPLRELGRKKDTEKKTLPDIPRILREVIYRESRDAALAVVDMHAAGSHATAEGFLQAAEDMASGLKRCLFVNGTVDGMRILSMYNE